MHNSLLVARATFCLSDNPPLCENGKDKAGQEEKALTWSRSGKAKADKKKKGNCCHFQLNTSPLGHSQSQQVCDHSE